MSVFIQKHARHDYLAISEWKSFQREVDTDIYLATVRLQLDEDDNHHHHHHDHDHDLNHKHDKEQNQRNNQLDFGRGKKRRRVISSEGSGNGQNNEDWAESLHCEVERYRLRQFRIQHNRLEQVLPPVQIVSGAPVYMSNLRTAQEEAIRTTNIISPYIDEESSVSWTSPESINQERDTPIANFRTAQQLLAAFDNQEQLNQQVNTYLQQQINQHHEVSSDIQIQFQDVTINNTQQNEQIQQIDIIDLEQNTQQQIEDIPRNEQGDINERDQQPTQTDIIRTPQTEAPDNLQHQQTGQDDEEHTAAVCIQPKQSRKRERYDVRRTEEPKVCPTKTFFVWLARLSEYFQQSPTNIIHLFWTENLKQADQKYISTRLERLVQTLGVQNATANSIRHASSTELAAQCFDGRTINAFTHHTPDLKMNKGLHIFAINREQDSKASALVKNHGMKQATQIISKQRGGARVSEGDGLQQSPQGDDLQQSPQETLASPLSPPDLFIPTHR
ncbi:MAG: hypothetical protein EZS28_011585 [Streblomastix strix]|uniref:Tyr recombinase domain-containing protein n=1 Tax=Streblomastix strix TaxID=222440 RepID=A0A5J4WEB0_9EUKA|nr:MAG: hypothetical protein EZS28_011585 [Streblomastix strix]